jgi:quercetin dioxygenase-like cupin family protein
MKLSKLRRPALALGIFALAVLSVSPSKTSNRSGQIPPEVVNFMAAYGADAVTIDRGSRDYKLPDQIQWQGRPGTTNQSAVVFGDPAKPGLYITLLKRGPNDWSQPHSHPNDRIIHVLAGTMWIGTGSKLDRDKTVPIKAGGYIHDIAGQPHYDGTKEDGLTIEIVGMGPATSIPANGK